MSSSVSVLNLTFLASYTVSKATVQAFSSSAYMLNIVHFLIATIILLVGAILA